MTATIHRLRPVAPVRALHTVLPVLMRDREERRRVRKFAAEHRVAPITEPSEADKAALTALDICWRCRQPLDARKFSAWYATSLGEGVIASHGRCA